MKFFRAALFASTILAFASVASAETVNPLADREDKIVPAVLLWMQETGVKLTFLGNEGGIRGYLAESAAGNMQTAYVTPDGTHAVLGLLYDEGFNKENLTGKQLTEMRSRYDQVAEAVRQISLDDKVSLPEALSKINIPRPAFDLPTFSSVDDNAPILNTLRSHGYQLTLLGEEGGVRGYLAAFGKIKQPIYVTPDGKHFIMGSLFQRGGKNVSGVQIGEMRARFDAQSGTTDAASTASKIDAAPAASPDTKVAVKATDVPAPAPAPQAATGLDVTLPPVPAEPIAKAGQSEAPVAGGEPPVSSGIPEATAPAPVSNSAPAPTLPEAEGPAQGADGNPSAFWYSNIDKGAFLEAMRTATYFDVGSQSAPTTLYMVADPNCPFCHQTWDYVKSYVQSGSLKVRIIMIAFLPGSDEKAREIMLATRPGIAYLESDGGRNVKFTHDANSEQWKAMAGHLTNNRNFATRFHISATPFLAYEDKDGTFYAVEGVPANRNFDAFFAAAHLTKK